MPLSWSDLARRTWREVIEDDVLGLAAQLSYYFFLALFPAILFLLAVASFFPLSNITDDVGRTLGPFVSPQVLELIKEQMRRLANNENGGLLTFGVAGALWSSSAALVSIVGALNRAYDIEEGRPWWKVRLVAISLTLGVALIVLVALSLVLVGPTLADKLGQTTGWGAPFEWTWLILQWPVVFALVATGIGLIYYFGPDAEQDWAWITPGAIAATMLWLLASLLFKIYVANFIDYAVDPPAERSQPEPRCANRTLLRLVQRDEGQTFRSKPARWQQAGARTRLGRDEAPTIDAWIPPRNVIEFATSCSRATSQSL